jgi:hypothetical protein
MSIDYQIFVDQEYRMAECFGRVVVVGPDTVPVQFCDYKEKKWNKWLTLKGWNKVCIPAKTLTAPVEHGTIIVDGSNEWYVIDPKPCMPGPVLISYCAEVCENKFIHDVSYVPRAITAPQGGSVDFGIQSMGGFQFLSMIETVNGEENFDGSGQIINATHRFTIPFVEGITSEGFLGIVEGVELVLYRILDVENLNKEDKFLSVLATIRGSGSKPINLS